MQKYIYIAIVFLALIGYIGWLKYDYSQLEHSYRDLAAENAKNKSSLKLSEEFNSIQKQKFEQTLENLEKLQQPETITKKEFVVVDTCKVEINSVDTNPKTATGIPLFLGNIGK